MKKQLLNHLDNYACKQVRLGFVPVSVLFTFTGINMAFTLVNPLKAEQIQLTRTTKTIQSLALKAQKSTSAQDLLVQSPAPSIPTQTPNTPPSKPPLTQVVPVTQVKLVPTKNGVQVILTTPIQAQAEIISVPTFGNESLIYIKNARLQLP